MLCFISFNSQRIKLRQTLAQVEIKTPSGGETAENFGVEQSTQANGGYTLPVRAVSEGKTTVVDENGGRGFKSEASPRAEGRVQGRLPPAERLRRASHRPDAR